MPEGAVSLDLENLPRFRGYAAANVESWYRFVNGPRLGREAKNGDIRLVTGCDKTNSWGMAALANVSQEQTNSLRFKALHNPHNTSACAYIWDCSGMAEARVGPDLQESNDLRGSGEHPDAEDDGDTRKYMNQCLFVRTLNVTLGHDMWEKINQELALHHEISQDGYSNSSGKGIVGPSSTGNTSSNTTNETGSPSLLNGRGLAHFSLSSDEESLMHVMQHYGNTGPFRFENLDMLLPSSRSPFIDKRSDKINATLTVDRVNDDSSNLDKFDWTPHTFSGSSEGSTHVPHGTPSSDNDSNRMLITTTPGTSVRMHKKNSLS